VIQSHDFSGIKTQNLDDVFSGIRHFYPSGTMAQSENVNKINGFDEKVPEWDFYLRLVRECGSAAIIDQPLVRFNREDIDRVSEQQRDYIDQFDIFHRYKHLVSECARKKRIGNLYYTCYKKSDNILLRYSSLFRSIYYNPRVTIRIFETTTGRILSILGLKQSIKRLLNRI
jgi:hypothetical protein